VSRSGHVQSPTVWVARADRFAFDESTADSVVRWIEARCQHWQGEFAGKPFILEPWQRDDIVRPLFGWKRIDPTVPRVDWPRAIQTGYVEVPKGNGKTALAAVILCAFLFWDCEPGAELYSAAADKDQASLVFADTTGMILQSPELARRCMVFEGKLRVVVPESRSFYRVLSSIATTKHGFRPHYIAIDELHTQPNRRLFSTLRTALSKRRQPAMLSFTTAGEFDANSLCWSEHEYAEACIRGEQNGGIDDPSHLAVIYAADKDDDPGSPETHRKANPNYAITVKPDALENEWRQALKKGPAAQAEFKTLHLNIWASALNGAIDMAQWNECSAPPIPQGPCYVGADLSSKLDLTSVVMYFPETHSLIPFFWVPGDNIVERKRKDAFDYQLMAERKLLYATPGNWVDQEPIVRRVRAIDRRYRIVDFGYDSWNASQFAVQLTEHGIPVTEARTGRKSMSEPTQYLIGLVRDRKLRHGGHAVLSWNAQNMQVSISNAGWLPVKDTTGRKRIDGMVAAIMAIGRALVNSPPDAAPEADAWVLG
jgi:phage terminase large subunit-like protein